ncbi:MAG: hypothetical protein JKY56_23215 [Kofleriaceae bacterium]|nr:hypothetical protein [Kofleriaceae bacterium]
MRLTSVLTSILLLPLCVAALPTSSAHAEALNPGDACEQELEREASQLIFDLTLELGRHNSLSSDEFSRIEKPLQTLRAHGQSPQALSCFGQYPFQKERYENWFRLQSHKVVTKTGQRLNQVCARQTRIFITTKKLHIDSAVAKNRLAKASKLAAQMEKSLRKSPMMSQCPTTKKRVDRLLGSYLPEVINQAALPKVLGDMSKSYFQAKHKVDAGMLALQSEGATMVPVPGSLDQAQGE